MSLKFKKRVILVPVLSYILLSSLVGMVFAIPQTPHQFYGAVTINGSPAPDGTEIDAYIEGTLFGSTTTNAGVYGYDPLFYVSADDPDTGGVEGGVSGDIVDMYVDGVYVKSFDFTIGDITELDFDFNSHDVDLWTGWNLVGLPVLPSDNTVELVFDPIIGSVLSIWAYEPFGGWSSYSPGAPSSLSEVSSDFGYWVNVDSDVSFTIYGSGGGSVYVGDCPLDGQTVQIGYISASDSNLGVEEPLVVDIITPDLNDYAASLGLDLTFEFLIDDADTQAAIHLEKVQGLKSMGVDIFLGGKWSSQAQASLSYVNANDMLMVSSSSTSPLLAIPDDRLFRTCPNDLVQGPAIAEMWDSWGVDAVLIVQRADSWADGLYNIIVPELEAKGITVIDRVRYSTEETEYSAYLATMDSLLGDAISTYGADRVGVQTMSFDELVVIVTQSEDFPNTRAVIWMGTESSGRSQRILDDGGGRQVDLRCFSALMTPAQSWKWADLEERYSSLVGQPASFYTATDYDAAWITALSIIQTQSTDASVVATALPDVSRNYFGASGWVDLDENGDRNPGLFDIWGYTDTGYQVWGQYDGVQDIMYWDDAKLAAVGITRPGS